MGVLERTVGERGPPWTALGTPGGRLGPSGSRPRRLRGGFGGRPEARSTHAPSRSLSGTPPPCSPGDLWGRLGTVLGASWAVLEQSWGPRGPSWGDLGGLLGRFRPFVARQSEILKNLQKQLKINDFCLLGASWEASWRPLGASWGPLGPSWSHLRASWRPLGPSRTQLWPFRSALGPSWSRLGRLLGRLGRLLGRLGRRLGRLGAVQGLSWGPLGILLGRLGANWEAPGATLSCRALERREL